MATTTATAAEWIEGARPRTLPAAISPVLAGTAVAVADHGSVVWKALLALVVSLALQVGVNYANDYSDGIRGTDAIRVGPLRLVGSGLASPADVKRAAFASFGVAGIAGLVLVATSGWWLLFVGATAILSAWYYTGGARPYGYRGLGELFVFVFFGLVAVLGTAFVQTGTLDELGVWLAIGVGCLACAILVANNLRDIPTDTTAGKQTLAVRLGDARSRDLFATLHITAFGCLVVATTVTSHWILLGLIGAPLSVRAQLVVRRGATGRELIPALRDTGLTELLYAAGALLGVLVAVS